MEKDELRQKFSEEYEKHYKVRLFDEEGFKRYRCRECGAYFWSADESSTCGDASCEPYSFIRKNWKKGDYVGMWKRFASFFKKEGHAVINRYPVIARWRPDLYFTIASIVDFMRVENGTVVWEYPENPLVVPQMCLRFPDIPNVGLTGRHHTSFIMAGQHAFLDGNENAYWKNRCIELNFRFLTEILGIAKGDLRFKEDVWAMPDLSSFGPCIETFSRGVELVNSVFTEYSKVGDEIRELDMKVIDVGWGFERLVWYESGAPTSYDANLGYAVEWMIEKSGVKYDKELLLKYAGIAGRLDVDEHADMEEVKAGIAKEIGVSAGKIDEGLGALEAIYAIADHTKTIVFALADGGLPSNVGGGYNLRVVLRRAQAFIDEFRFPFKLEEVAMLHINYLKEMFPELANAEESLHEVFEIEVAKYKKMLERAEERIVALAKKGGVDDETLMREYESNGISPEIIEEVAKKKGISIDVPSDFYAKLTERHVFAEVRKEEKMFDPAGFEKTRLLYYEDADECDAVVAGVQGRAVVLDQTCFYPEGGGQKFDTGFINDIKVGEVYAYSGVVFHVVDDAGVFSRGQKVHCRIDKKRRLALERHHTATHIVGGVCRKLLGRHVWQAGAHKDVDKAVLDITHYKNLDWDEIKKIELLANEVVLAGIKTDIKEYERGEAEKKFGFVLYQGGGSPGRRIRVMKIGDVDVEACGGLHVKNTGDIGFIKIMKTERIQDGVVRLVYSAGEAAVDYVQKMEDAVRNASSVFSVSYFDLPKTSKRFFEEWKERGRRIEALEKAVAMKEAEIVEGVVDVEYSREIMDAVAKQIIRKGKWAVMINKQGFVVAAAGKESGKNAREEIEKLFEKRKGIGGGNERIAKGKLFEN